MATLYVRGVNATIIKKLKREAKRCGYATLGEFLNVILKKIEELEDE